MVAAAEVPLIAIEKVPTTVPDVEVLRTVPVRAAPVGAVPTATVIARTRAANGMRATTEEVVATAPVTVSGRTVGADADIFDLQVKEKYWNTYVCK
jgi:hypothetical protein